MTCLCRHLWFSFPRTFAQLLGAFDSSSCVFAGESVLAFGEVIPSFIIARHETFSDDTGASSNTCFVDQH